MEKNMENEMETREYIVWGYIGVKIGILRILKPLKREGFSNRGSTLSVLGLVSSHQTFSTESMQ